MLQERWSVPVGANMVVGRPSDLRGFAVFGFRIRTIGRTHTHASISAVGGASSGSLVAGEHVTHVIIYPSLYPRLCPLPRGIRSVR